MMNNCNFGLWLQVSIYQKSMNSDPQKLIIDSTAIIIILVSLLNCKTWVWFWFRIVNIYSIVILAYDYE